MFHFCVLGVSLVESFKSLILENVNKDGAFYSFLKKTQRLVANLKGFSLYTIDYLSVTFSPPPYPDVSKVGINLHLGSGKVHHPSFINIDGYPYPNIHHVKKIDNLSFFKNESVDLIYASHCLEHFEYLKIEKVLSEWFRVLKKGGILRLSVPDFDKLLQIYNVANQDLDFVTPQLLGGQENIFNYHYVLFNKSNLSRKLKNVGFTDCNEWVPGSNDLKTFQDFSIYEKEFEGLKYTVSLNIEATK